MSDKMVRRVLRLLQKADAASLDVGIGYIATTVGARLYIVYLREDQI